MLMMYALNGTSTRTRTRTTVICAALAFLAVPGVVQAQNVGAPDAIPSPEEFFGHAMGADRQLGSTRRLLSDARGGE
ncbi:MAG: hypothetical protein ACPHQP_01860 [Longimicrobiales bacterium]